MQKDRLNQICKSFCTAFPNIEFALLDPGGRPAQVHSPRGLLAQMAGGPPFAGHTAVLEGVPYRVLRHALPQGYQVAALFSVDDPAQHSFAPMADTLARLVLAQGPAFTPQKNNALFFNHLLHTAAPDKQSCLSLLSTDFAYDLSLPRFICVLEAARPQAAQPVAEQSMADMLEFVRHHPSVQSQDIIGLLNPDKLVICKAVTPADYPLKACCDQMLGGLVQTLQLRFSVSLRVGVGFVAEQISEYSFCLKAAHAVLQSTGGGPFLFAVDTLPRMLINAVPPERLHHYFADCAQLLNHHADWLSTLDALVQSNMDLAAAAAGLYLHKNSLIFRLKHMLRELRLDSLQSDQTKYFLILLYHYCQHFAQEPDAP